MELCCGCEVVRGGSRIRALRKESREHTFRILICRMAMFGRDWGYPNPEKESPSNNWWNKVVVANDPENDLSLEMK